MCFRVRPHECLLIAIVSMGLGIAANTACAAPPPPPAPPFEQSPAPPALSAEATDLAAFEQLDGNEDGYLSGKESLSVVAYDTNGDKRVTRSEFLAGRAKARGVDPAVEDNKQFLQLDGNEDDSLSGKEMKGLERYDTNSDRELSKAEFLAGRAADRGAAATGPRVSIGPATFETFFAAVAQRDVKGMLGQMHPDLQKQVDEPVLHFFLDAIKAELGAMSDDEPKDRTQNRQELGGAPMTMTAATIEFTNGTADCEVGIQEGKVVNFKINSDKLDELDRKLGERLQKDKDFRKQASAYYALRGEVVIGLIFQGKPEEVHALLHPEVQEQVTLETAKAYIQNARTVYGTLKHVEFDGVTESYDLATEKLNKYTVNYKLDCENGPAAAKIILQFVGLNGALVGFSVSEPAEDTPAEPVTAPTTIYRHAKDSLSDSHAEKFVPFRFAYPEGWTLDPEAGTEASPNSVKVMRDIDIGNGQTYTQENFAVGSCQVTGSGELAKLGLQLLSEQFQTQISKGFPEYKLSREGDMKLGDYAGFGFEFTSKLPHPHKGQVDCWGRVILLAPSAIQQDKGLAIIMLATSEAPELTSLADLGVKGQLPVIINSFKIGAVESDVPEDNAKAAAHYERASQLADQGDLTGAIAELTEAIKLEPENTEGYVARGNLLYLNKDLRGALADYTLAIKADPNHVVAHNNSGVMRYYLDDLDGAMEEYALAIKLDEQYALAYSNRGLVKLLRYQDAAAQLDFDKALKLDSKAEFAAQQAEDIREAKLRRADAIPAPPRP